VGVDDGRFRQERGIGLLHDEPFGLEDAQALAVEPLREATFRGSHGIGAVYDDHVQAFVLGVRNALHTVPEPEFSAWVCVGLAQLGEVEFREPCYTFVKFRLHHRFHALVPQHLTQGAAVTAAEDQHAPRGGVGEERRMRQHLVVDEAVAVREHHAAVYHHEGAEAVGLEDLDGLPGSLLGVQAARAGQGEGDALLRDNLAEPVAVESHGGPARIYGGLYRLGAAPRFRGPRLVETHRRKHLFRGELLPYSCAISPRA